MMISPSILNNPYTPRQINPSEAIGSIGGSHPSQKPTFDAAYLGQRDSEGYTPIDYTVFEGKADQLPALFGQAQKVYQKVAAQSSEEIETFLESGSAQNCQHFLSQFNEENLADRSGASYEKLSNFLKQCEHAHFSTFGTRIVHLIAALGNVAVLKVALELFPDAINQTDQSGNIPLHYSAFQRDEKLFIELVKRDAHLFAENNKLVTPLGLFVHEIEKRDSLKLSFVDLLVFLKDWLPTASSFLAASGLLSVAHISKLDEIISESNFWTDLMLYSSLFAQLKQPGWRTFFFMATLGSNVFPILGIPVRIYTTCSILSSAYRGIKAAYYQKHIRPLKALSVTLVHTSNAVNCVQSIFQYIKDAAFVAAAHFTSIKVDDVVNGYLEISKDAAETCGEELPPILKYRDFIDTKKLNPNSRRRDLFELNPDYPKTMICALNHFEKQYSWILSMVPPIGNYYFKMWKPAAIESLRACPKEFKRSGERGFEACQDANFLHYFKEFFKIRLDSFASTQPSSESKVYKRTHDLSGMSIEQRLEAVKQHDTLEGALDIIQQSDLCYPNNAYKECKKLKVQVHPDKHPQQKEYYNKLYLKLTEACSYLKDACKNFC